MPAPAGVHGADHPRIRGEHPRPRRTQPPRRGSSPHTRGAPRARPDAGPCGRIIPAYAGSTAAVEAVSVRDPDHPRIRGEHAVFVGGLSMGVGSSPHTRGAPRTRRRSREPPGIIPAYAGSTTSATSPRSSAPDHPRIRGEHGLGGGGGLLDLGSSPHTRGAHRGRRRRAALVGIIPAYAGSTIRAKAYDPNRRDHPRIRGEHLNAGAAHRVAQGSSPHTRGAPPTSASRTRSKRIIPAYAGSTRAGRRPCRRSGDHPRIRGEHPPLRRR